MNIGSLAEAFSEPYQTSKTEAFAKTPSWMFASVLNMHLYSNANITWEKHFVKEIDYVTSVD